jgi:hypothetical protein
MTGDGGAAALVHGVGCGEVQVSLHAQDLDVVSVIGCRLFLALAHRPAPWFLRCVTIVPVTMAR